jgi:heptosyltransferase-1
MSEILFVKTSSLGDVIHHMPALTEARRRFPDTRFSWVVEEDLVPLVRLHPAVDAVIAVASRRWRRAPVARSTWREMASFSRAVRERSYAEIVDTQGLLRSALIARHARGRRHGYDMNSIRERLACPLYDVRHAVSQDFHAIRRNRTLTGLALGYVPDAAIDFGLPREKLAGARGYGLLFHATARPEKQWPQHLWIALGHELRARGLPLVLPWGTPAERQRSEYIAAAVPGAQVPDRRPLDSMARLVAGASFVVGVDTGLVHLAAALGVPLVAIFVSSKPGLTGPMGQGPIAIVGGEHAMPSVVDVTGALDRIL